MRWRIRKRCHLWIATRSDNYLLVMADSFDEALARIHQDFAALSRNQKENHQ